MSATQNLNMNQHSKINVRLITLFLQISGKFSTIMKKVPIAKFLKIVAFCAKSVLTQYFSTNEKVEWKISFKLLIKKTIKG